MTRPRLIVFTDLDGTLLDAKTYDFQAALPAIHQLKHRHIPLIFCSSKTRIEIDRLRLELDVQDPFIVENGGAIYVPLAMCPKGVLASLPAAAGGEGTGDGEFPHVIQQRGDYLLIEFGRPYHELRQGLQMISKHVGLELKGFGEMSIEEISRRTGLSVEKAKMASQREYDEPFLVPEEEGVLAQIRKKASDLGFGVLQGGKFAHLIAGTDKGRACRFLIDWYRQQKGSVITAAFGDSLNDLPMLAAVDHPYLVEQNGGGHQPGVTLERVVYLQGEGPDGWCHGIGQFLECFGSPD